MRIKRSDFMDHCYDSDLHLVVIDNCSTACIMNSTNDFIGTPEKISITTCRIGGNLLATFKALSGEQWRTIMEHSMNG